MLDSRPVRLTVAVVSVALVAIGTYGAVTGNAVPTWVDILLMVLVSALAVSVVRRAP